MKLYFHPISSYSQKALFALYEKGIAFTPEIVDLFSDAARAAYAQKYPLAKLPLLETDDGRLIPESSILIEYLDQKFPGSVPRLIPDDPELARQTRFYDRVFDLYVNEPMQKVLFDATRPNQDPWGVEKAKTILGKSYDHLDARLANAAWANGKDFSLADVAAAPALGYARMVMPFDRHKNLAAYFGRLAERPAFARVLQEAAPYLAKLGNRK